MSSLAIVFGFAVMVFLPCAIALLGSREGKGEEGGSAYADRLIDIVVKPRADEADKASAMLSTQSSGRSLGEDWGDLSDPAVPGRGPKFYVGQVEQAEAEVLRARAVAARAHADALAAVARAAAAKAEAARAQADVAASQAAALENEVAQVVHAARRAA